MESKQPTAFTIGHSNHPIWYFRFKLIQNEIDVLVDCRTFPQSRFASQFNRKALQAALETKHIKYLYKGKNLGGRGINENHEATVDELSDLIRTGLRVCFMCSEASPEKCHRQTMLEPSFKKRGIKFIHIICDDAPKKRSKPKQPRLFP